MKRILFLLFAVGLTANMTVMAGMSTSKVRKETRFLIQISVPNVAERMSSDKSLLNL